ncbi:hypothetical protein VQ02_23325 [Methylobacterium variabile]|jgi:hypothetical protein|uniref:Uncharacterized protein n=1 Tax=Methylobacterium variabile TaxID=298794 RepID=A0A0J6SBS0_9HYPH|nr:hypothetical protein [Methylobacterium variabile]KMO32650.1 hypothetical protein VQ02_23325 [Methylobacterium variabile]
MGPAGWVGRIDHVRVYLSDENGEASRAQAAVADMVSESLPALQDAASTYLDTFVDRQKACGSADERWWLDEIDFRGHPDAAPIAYSLLFTLHGDDGGLWTVDMRVFEDGHRPFRFERLQG